MPCKHESKQMLLERISVENFDSDQGRERALIVTKDTPRKAMFQKLNRHGVSMGARKRVKRRAGVLRGNSFAGYGSSQRVVVKISVVKNKTKGVGVGAGSGGKNLYHHIHYVSRSKAGKDGDRAVLFDKENEGLGRKDFFECCKDDRHHFRMIISPEKGRGIEDFQGYVRGVMTRVEKDLGTQLDWVSAVHYDTDDIHAHVIVRGKNDKGEDLVIGRDYISYGIRSRAQELATELLGERSLEDIQKSLEAEIDAMRVTSLDRFIERHVDQERQLDVRKENNFGKSSSYEVAVKGRLRFLQSTGLASEYPPGVFTLKEKYTDTLYEAGRANDIIKQLHRGGLEDLSDLSIYSLKNAEGKSLEGRLVSKGYADELNDRKYIVLDEIGGGKHYVPLGEYARYDELKKGTLLRVRSGHGSTGKADHNIQMIAGQNKGIYDEALHMRHIEAKQKYIPEEKREAYIDSHRKRLETLEKNGVINALDDGCYQIPEDVIEHGKEITKKINERENKRFYPRLDVLSKEAPEKQAQEAKVTWLDKELFKRSKGKSGLENMDVALNEALEVRKDWLIQKELGLVQANGAFVFKGGAFKSLRRMEVVAKGEELAAKVGLEFSTNLARNKDVQVYYGYAELESGLWAVTRKDKVLYMSPVDVPPNVTKGKKCILEQDERNHYSLQEIELQKQRSKEEQRERDDNEREL